MTEKEKRNYGARVTSCTKIGIARNLLTGANATLHNAKLRQALMLIMEALTEEERYDNE
jgi:hypothetical protein